MRNTEKIDFERLVVLSNPRSSNADKAAKITATLEKKYPGKIVKGTIGKAAAENIKLLKNTLRPGDILLICGGDGTAGNMIEYLLDPSMPKVLRQTPVLPVGTGRMCDLARMTNGRYYRNPRYVLRHGKKLQIHPIACVCKPLDGGKPVKKLAVYNIGFGYSGLCSIAWNDPVFRANLSKRTAVTRPVEFFKAGSHVLKKTTFFDMTYRDKRRAVVDITAAVGHIYGGYGRMPARLSQREFYFVVTDDKSLLGTMRNVAQIIANRFSGGELAKSVSFTLHGPVVGHVGGETFTPPAPCEVRITHHKEPVIMLATSPKV